MPPVSTQLPSGAATPVTTSLSPRVFQTVGGYIPAQADAAANVADIMQLSDGTRIESGKVRWPGHGLTVGAYYFLSQATAGGIQPLQPAAGLVQRLLFVEDVDTIHINIEPAYTVSQQGTMVASGFVASGSVVSLDNLQIKPTSSVGDGFQLAAVATPFTYDISGGCSYGLNADSIWGGSRVDLSATTAFSTPFASWASTISQGNVVEAVLYDTTAVRVYRLIIILEAAPKKCFVSINRLS